MKHYFKNSFGIIFALTGLRIGAREKTLERLIDSANQSLSETIDDGLTVTAEKSFEIKDAKTLITKAERQTIGRLKNIYKIDEDIYRSEQPGKNDFISLEKIGLAEVLSLRRFWNDNRKARKTDLKLHHVSMKAGKIHEHDIIKALRVINERKGPLLIHCWHGSDRTGVLIAMYRLVFQNWSKNDAINEMTKGDFGFHAVYVNIVEFIQNANVDVIRDKVVRKQPADEIIPPHLNL